MSKKKPVLSDLEATQEMAKKPKKKKPSVQKKNEGTNPMRRCHDCKKPTRDYRCTDCRKLWASKHGVVLGCGDLPTEYGRL